MPGAINVFGRILEARQVLPNPAGPVLQAAAGGLATRRRCAASAWRWHPGPARPPAGSTPDGSMRRWIGRSPPAVPAIRPDGSPAFASTAPVSVARFRITCSCARNSRAAFWTASRNVATSAASAAASADFVAWAASASDRRRSASCNCFSTAARSGSAGGSAAGSAAVWPAVSMAAVRPARRMRNGIRLFPVVGVAGKDLLAAVELFGQHHANQHVRPGCPTEADRLGPPAAARWNPDHLRRRLQNRKPNGPRHASRRAGWQVPGWRDRRHVRPWPLMDQIRVGPAKANPPPRPSASAREGCRAAPPPARPRAGRSSGPDRCPSTSASGPPASGRRRQ